MKRYLFLAAAVSCSPLLAGESSLTTTYQPLDGLASTRIHIVPVTCHHWFSSSASSPVDLIAIPNVPPTDNPGEATENLNLASVYGIKFDTSDLGSRTAPLALTLDASNLRNPDGKRFDHSRETVVRASLECLRRCIPEKLAKTPLTLKANAEDRAWLEKIVAEFNKHDRAKVFFGAAG